MNIKFDFRKHLNVKNNVKRASIAAATAAMCFHMGLNAEDTEAAKAAMHDIAQAEGTGKARAVIIDMNNGHGDDPFGGFIA